jgi:hypothetical protein
MKSGEDAARSIPEISRLFEMVSRLAPRKMD